MKNDCAVSHCEARTKLHWFIHASVMSNKKQNWICSSADATENVSKCCTPSFHLNTGKITTVNGYQFCAQK